MSELTYLDQTAGKSTYFAALSDGKVVVHEQSDANTYSLSWTPASGFSFEREALESAGITVLTSGDPSEKNIPTMGGGKSYSEVMIRYDGDDISARVQGILGEE